MVSPTTWGTHVWYSIHLIALGYPDAPTVEHKRQYHAFYHQLANVLPCAMCREHYAEILHATLPLTMERLASQSALFAWTVEVHNIVNRSLNKPTMTLESAVRYYANFKEHIERKRVVYKTTSRCHHTAPVPDMSQSTAYSHLMGLQDATAIAILVVFLILNVKIIMNTR